MKRCSTCKQLKTKDKFFKRKTNKDGLRSQCKQCEGLAYKKYKRSKKGLINRIYNQQKSSSIIRGHEPPKYNELQLYEWVTNNNRFDMLFRRWVLSGYKSKFIPSVDRLDNSKGYSFGNIQLVNWHINNINAIRHKRKQVVQYDLNGNKLNVFSSTCQAQNITNIDRGTISKNCSGVRKTAGGYIWKFK